MIVALERQNKTTRMWLRVAAILLPTILVIVQLAQYQLLTNDFVYEVPEVTRIAAFETAWLYALIHVFSFLPVFLFSFEPRIAYYKSWKYLFPAILLVGVFFVIWDVVFTGLSVWNFNSTYHLGIKLISLPIEEWLFFIVIPFSSIFIYENINYYLKKDLLARAEPFITVFLLGFSFAIGLIYWEKLNTSVTFFLTGGFLLYHFLFLPAWHRSRFYFSFIGILIPFIIVDTILTGGFTDTPIVIYNPEEYTGFRIFSIPIEDIPFGFMMLLWIVTLMETWRKKQ